MVDDEPLLAATPDGVYRVSRAPFEAADPVLDAGARELLAPDGAAGVFAATGTGLYRTTDGGETWRDLGVPVADVHSVAVGDGAVHAGVRPAAVYRSRDGGATWTALSSLRDSSVASAWPTAPGHEHAHVRSLASPAPGVVLVGVEVGGLVVTTDGGASWQGIAAVPDDVHDVRCPGDERWVASCGTGGPAARGGVHRTVDGGETWTRLDTDGRPYVRASCSRDRLYTAAARTAPPWTPPDAALLVERDRGLEPVPYPGAPTSFVVSWTTTADAVLAGTNDGRVLRGRGDEWRSLGTVPVAPDDRRAFGVTSLAIPGP